MKRLLFIILFLILPFLKLSGQWQIMNEGVPGDLNSIDFINPNIGWLAGDNGTLLKTEDGGQTWLPLMQERTLHFSGVDFVNDSVGWSIGYFGVNDGSSDVTNIISKSIDGGRTWTIVEKSKDLYYGVLGAVDDSVVYIAGNKILKTVDGGVNWSDVTPVNKTVSCYSICFFDRNIGVIAGSIYNYWRNSGTMLKTIDGGKTWQVKADSAFSELFNIQFINDSTGYFLGTDENYKSFLCETRDTGATWTVKWQPGSHLNSFYCLDKNTFFAAMVDSVNNNSIWKSIDGGLNWTKNDFFSNFFLNKIYFKDYDVGFVIGYCGSGLLLRSVDQGNHWTPQILSYPFYDVFFLDQNNGFACGGFSGLHYATGNIFVTQDGGITWNMSHQLSGIGESCYFKSDSIGFIQTGGYWGEYATLKTTNRGKSWTKTTVKIDSTDFNLSSLFFVNDKIGWASSNHSEHLFSTTSVILSTKNGGEDWTIVWKDTSAINSLCFLNEKTGWAVGDNGLVLKYSDQGHWQKFPPFTDQLLTSVFFINENTGWMAQGNRIGFFIRKEFYIHSFFKTVDGGETWEEFSTSPYLFYDFYFQDQQHGWAVGTDSTNLGVICETLDGGKNWTAQLEGLTGKMRSLHCSAGYLWAVGENGLILKNYIGIPVQIDEKNTPANPSDFHLFQNYPNPFNPVTAISYQLPVVSDVKLAIYDINGRQIRRLIHARQQAGEHQINWDGTDEFNLPVSAGIYFGVLAARNCLSNQEQKLVKVIKLALVK